MSTYTKVFAEYRRVSRLLRQGLRECPEATGWYARARTLCEGIAERQGLSLCAVVGICAALSPRCTWDFEERNLESWISRRGNLDWPTFNLHKRRALEILDGIPPLTVLRGPKTRSFYRAIMGNTREVVIDTWMLRAVGRRETSRVTNATLQCIRGMIRLAAHEQGVTPREAQAVIWETVRRQA